MPRKNYIDKRIYKAKKFYQQNQTEKLIWKLSCSMIPGFWNRSKSCGKRAPKKTNYSRNDIRKFRK